MSRSPRPSGARPVGLRAQTRRVFRPSGPPTDEIPLWTSTDGIDDPTARRVIDLALRVGVAVLATGAGAADVVATVIALTRAYGLRSTHVDVTYTSVMVSYHRGPQADPITVLRVVRQRSQDFTRLERLRALVTELANDPVDLQDARERLDAVVGAPHPYRRWFVTAASAMLAAAVSVLIGGGWLVALLSVICAVAIDRVQHVLARLGVAAFFAQVVAAAIPTLVATLVVLLGIFWEPAANASPSLIVASGIVLLLAGLSVVGAATDALEGYYVTAGARVFEVVVLTIGIAIGVTLVLALGARLGLPIAFSERTFLDNSRLVQLACAATISAAFAVSSYAVGRAIAAAAVLGVIGWEIWQFIQGQGIGPAPSAAMAALVVGFVARAAARRLGTSALAVTTAAIVPILPGRAVYQGISQIISGSEGTGVALGLPTLAGAAGTALALASGVGLGTYLAGLLSAWRHGRKLLAAPGADRGD